MHCFNFPYIRPINVYIHRLHVLACYRDTLKELYFKIMTLIVIEAHYKKQSVVNMCCENIVENIVHYITYDAIYISDVMNNIK